MKIFPSETFTIQTSMSVPEIIGRMEKYVEPKKYFRFFTGDKFFEGKITDRGFKLSRIILYHNSFLPTVKGLFEERGRGLHLTISMTLHPHVIVFMVAWYVAWLGFSISTVIFFKSPATFNPALLVPTGMMFFGWVMTAVGFWPEARKAKKQLMRILFSPKGLVVCFSYFSGLEYTCKLSPHRDPRCYLVH